MSNPWPILRPGSPTTPVDLMVRCGIFLLGITLFVFTTEGAARIMPSSKEIDRSVVQIMHDVKAGTPRATHCSGVVLQLVPQAYILTEQHCVDGQELIYADNQLLIEVARDHEYVLMRAASSKSTWYPLHITQNDVKRGDSVHARGWAFGKFLAQVNGAVAGMFEDELFLNLEVIRGMSGGPVVNEEGQLISLLRGSQSDNENNQPSPNALAFSGLTEYARNLVVIMNNQK